LSQSEVTHEMIFFAGKSLFDAARIEKFQNQLLLNAALLIQPLKADTTDPGPDATTPARPTPPPELCSVIAFRSVCSSRQQPSELFIRCIEHPQLIF